MNKRIILAAAVLALLAACAPAGQSATSDQLSALEARVAALEGGSTGPGGGLVDMETRLAALEAQVTALEEMSGEGGHGEVNLADIAIAQYILDTAGFHGMDEALNETGVIEPSYLSAANRVAKVVGATTWPEDLHGPVEAFQTALTEFAAALEADDAETAAGLAPAVHETQHDLSHAIDGVLGGEGHDH